MNRDDFMFLTSTCLIIGFFAGAFTVQKWGNRGDRELLERGIIYHHPVTGELEWTEGGKDEH